MKSVQCFFQSGVDWLNFGVAKWFLFTVTLRLFGPMVKISPFNLLTWSFCTTSSKPITSGLSTGVQFPNAFSDPSTSGRLHSEFIRLLFLQDHRETDRFFSPSWVQLPESTSGGFFHFHRTAFSSMLKSRVSLILAKAAALRINLNLDGAPITSTSHTHPSHSQTSRLLTLSLSLGVPVPRPTQCMRDA